jgi:periplasmic protein TonB
VDSFIDRELLPAETLPTLSGRNGNFFRGAVIFSLLLHGSIVFLLARLPFGGVSGPSTTYVDLTVPEQATNAAAKPPMPPPTPEGIDSDEELPPVEEASDTVSSPPPPEVKPNLETASLSLGLGLGYFNSIAKGETLRDDIREYYFQVLKQINRSWWEMGGGVSQPMKKDALVEMIVARDGTIVQKRLIESSGNQWSDSLVMKTLEKASPLPPLPPQYPFPYFSAPVRVVRPLNLSIGSLM